MSTLSATGKRTLSAIALLVAVTVALAACSATPDPSNYIKDNYTRAATLDEGGLQAYTTSGSPETVASAISANADPIDRRTSSTTASADGGNAVFLQYSDVIVSVFPYENGSRVMLGDYERARSHYSTYIGGYWSSSPKYSGGGSSNRGGGIGTGK